MPTPSEVLWDRELHTAAKHKVYETYFNAWFPILLQSRYARGGITYAEGFAGPGEYADRSPGSPLIALRSALQCAAPPTPRRPVNFLLAERDGNRLYHLRGLLESELGSLDPTYLRSRGLTVDAREGDCETVLPRLLSEHQAWHKPMLVILDTWGAAVSFSLLRRIAGSKSAEAIVTIQPQHFVRFATDPEHFGDNIFGPVLWRDVQHQATPHKAEYIRSQYRRTLNEAAFRYVLDFQLADEKSNLLYLVYGKSTRTTASATETPVTRTSRRLQSNRRHRPQPSDGSSRNMLPAYPTSAPQSRRYATSRCSRPCTSPARRLRPSNDC